MSLFAVARALRTTFRALQAVVGTLVISNGIRK